MPTYQRIDGKFVFSDSVAVAAPSEAAFGLLWNANAWPEILPHVTRIRLLEERLNYQSFEMETEGAAGIHVTESIREATPHREIRYRQVKPPAMLTEHTGRWLIDETEGGVEITAEHTIEIRPEAIAAALGREYSLEEAALLSRHMIGNHSVATLRVVKEAAEAGVRVDAS